MRNSTNNLRRIKQLRNELIPATRETVALWAKSLAENPGRAKQWFIDVHKYQELYRLLDTEGLDADNINMSNWVKLKHVRRIQSNEYNKKPKRARKDNPNIYKGEEDNRVGCSLKDIRIPRKTKKNAWKRFRKNFPQFEPTNAGGVKFVGFPAKVVEYPLQPKQKKK